MMTAEECARVTRTIVFVNTVETAKELESFLKKAGACDSTGYYATWVLPHVCCHVGVVTVVLSHGFVAGSVAVASLCILL